MIYFSQLVKTKVRDSADVFVGRLVDVLVQPMSGQYAPILYAVVETRKHDELFIPASLIANIGSREITLKNLLQNVPRNHPSGEYVYLGRDILDEQIVDIDGARVVRVNDLQLG